MISAFCCCAGDSREKVFDSRGVLNTLRAPRRHQGFFPTGRHLDKRIAVAGKTVTFSADEARKGEWVGHVVFEEITRELRIRLRFKQRDRSSSFRRV
jgi:hypothetical protein